jgi:hypothetical protein
VAALAVATITGGACSGCSTMRSVTDVANAPARSTIDEKAVLGAEVAYGVVLDTVTAAARDGRLKGEQAALVAGVIRRVAPARLALHTALKAGNETDLLVKFNDLKQLTAELAAIGAQ